MAPLNEFYPSFYLLIFLSVLVSLKKTAKTFTEQFSLPFFFFFYRKTTTRQQSTFGSLRARVSVIKILSL